MNENQGFALHFIQINASFCDEQVLCFHVLFSVFNHSPFIARQALISLCRGVSLVNYWPQLQSLDRVSLNPFAFNSQSLIERSHFNLVDLSRPPQAIPLDMMSFDDPISPPKVPRNQSELYTQSLIRSSPKHSVFHSLKDSTPHNRSTAREDK